ncbi:T9SS type A sorting domain-containing protein [Hymenobacter sp. NST-14]|uniref:T9SS type A sorting domain-containing protein n=1 Tax=Hymenobacter piscis TaxID=2839984 RepID=UPI001C033B54|nr:T9SS type A sorting domain-containing protein [Hymenobacter piscis]MBT9395251.1 T9SS type A sorting domain-containing protein [Hymenobacter piscis]
MKTLSSILLIVLLLALPHVSRAQRTASPRHPLTKHFKPESRMKTTLAARGINAGITVPGRSVEHSWSGSAWEDGQISTYTYSAQGLPTQILYSDSATNAPEVKLTLAYNAQGLLTEFIGQEWTGTAYVNATRYVAAYDARGRETLFTTYAWQNNSWVIEFSERFTNAYNAAGVLTSVEYEELNRATNVWEKDSRTLFTVDANNQWTEVIEQEWENGAYENDERTHNIRWHNWAALQYAYLEEQDWDNGAWVDTDRETVTYQANGSYVRVQQKKRGSTWENDDRYTYTLDTNGNLILDQGESWDNTAWELNYATRYLLAYTPANVLRRSVEQQRSATSAYENRELITYGNFLALGGRRASGLEAAARLYPNPTTGMATFELSGLRQSGPVRAEVLNVLGQLVGTLELTSHQGTIAQDLDLRQQPAGLYLVRLHTAEGSIVQRLRKE